MQTLEHKAGENAVSTTPLLAQGVSRRARLARMLATRSDTLILLSATPHDGSARKRNFKPSVFQRGRERVEPRGNRTLSRGCPAVPKILHPGARSAAENSSPECHVPSRLSGSYRLLARIESRGRPLLRLELPSTQDWSMAPPQARSTTRPAYSGYRPSRPMPSFLCRRCLSLDRRSRA